MGGVVKAPYCIRDLDHRATRPARVQRGMRILSVALFLVGCGSDDGMSSIDAPNVPPTITISGHATKREGFPPTEVAAVGVAVAAYKNGSDATPVAMTMTDAAGNYTLPITTNGQPLDGYLKGTLAGEIDTYLYPPEPLIADFAMASINLLTQSQIDLLSGTLCGSGQVATNGMVAVLVTSATMTAVAGATVTSMPASEKYCYTGANALPDRNATATAADGLAFMLNVAAGQVTVSAMATGMTFDSHPVNARAGVFTTTVITP